MLNLSHNIHIVFVSKTDNVVKANRGNEGLDVSIWTSLHACVIAVTTEPFLRIFSFRKHDNNFIVYGMPENLLSSRKD